MKQFENLIRDKLKNFEAPENHGAWDAFNQKRLAKKKAINKKYFYSGLIGIVLVSIFTSIILFNSSNNAEKREIVEKQITDEVNETNIVKTNTNSDLVEQNSTNTNKNSSINVEKHLSNTENSIVTKAFNEEKHDNNNNNNIGVSEKDLTEKLANTN
ncbi:MAG: hypothetical protein GX879_02185, partial [Bacteroidales bacterium]|nr:hypothetical protein [Bacteroidales bacterium]